MSLTKEATAVTLLLPPDIYETAEAAANNQGRKVEDLLTRLVSDEMGRRVRAREAWEQLSRMYTERLEQEGKLNQTKEEILADLRQLREEVARDLYS